MPDDKGRVLRDPWMIDEHGTWQPPAARRENRARVAERGWVWVGPSDLSGTASKPVRICFRPSIVDAIAAQDTEAARAAMRTHLANSRERRRRAFSAPQ